MKITWTADPGDGSVVISQSLLVSAVQWEQDKVAAASLLISTVELALKDHTTFLPEASNGQPS